MTAPTGVTPLNDPAWAAYQAEESRAREQYIDTTKFAQRGYDEALTAATNAYHSVERAAWQHYEMIARAAKRRYLESLPKAGSAAPEAAQPYLLPASVPVDGPGSQVWPAGPAYTPTSERRA